MTLPANIPPGSVQDPDRPHVFWYPRGERHEVQFVVKPDPRDARIAAQAMAYEALAQECVWTHERIAELERYMRHIRTLANDAPSLVDVDPALAVAAIIMLANDALAGAEPEPTATTYEAMAI